MELREGIVVKSQKYQENSKIITLVNSDGLASFRSGLPANSGAGISLFAGFDQNRI